MAPCQYLQNQCRPGSVCTPCPERLPSCVGLPDGDNPIVGRYWTLDYIHCFRNRTIGSQTCRDGYFHPYNRRCMNMLHLIDVHAYCAIHPTSLVPSTENCARFYNCSLQTGYRDIHRAGVPVNQECPYPDLFSTITNRCEAFVQVNCGHRLEPQAPCEYSQNLCLPSTLGCTPCLTRLPSCVGLPDGATAIPGREYTDTYLHCYLNRTIQVQTCDVGFFDPGVKLCVTQINSGNIGQYCKRNPFAVLAHPTNCAWYYNCSVAGRTPLSVYPFDTFYVQECPYPKLFSTASMTCEAFARVTCGVKFEPQAPCEYYKNRCDPTTSGCIPCPNRLPSCKTLADDQHTISNLYDGTTYLVQCLTNRTLSYHPCIGNAGTCAAGLPSTTVATSTVTSTVNTLPAVQYTGPTLPPGIIPLIGVTDYPWTSHSTPPTPARITALTLPTSTRLPPVITPLYTTPATPHIGNIPTYCKAHPLDVLADPTNCAQYYDCSEVYNPWSRYLKECPYPLLFHPAMRTCSDYSMVWCGDRFEPQAPCEYHSNQCFHAGCIPCEERFVSCVGKPDGNHAIPGRQGSRMYVRCHSNRTIATEECAQGVFDPISRHCVAGGNPGTTSIPGSLTADLCQNGPFTVKPHPLNCAQYVNCSVTNYWSLEAIRECEYPKLFSPLTLRCQDFDTLHCGPRHEPKAPCEYLQNLCNGSRPDCIPCVERLPSCLGLPDGDNAVDNKTWISDYVHCYKERTLEVKKCANRFVFDPHMRKCVQGTAGSLTADLCQNGPFTVKPHPLNCAQYVDCSVTNYWSLEAIRECEYPKLFSPLTLRCQDFDTLHCGPRHEPKAPCEYLQNLCNGSQSDCIPCVERLPSCLGLPDGENAVDNKTWISDYVRCYKERTLEVKKCANRFVFDPNMRKCVQGTVGSLTADLCNNGPFTVKPHPLNCAQYVDCSVTNYWSLEAIRECEYPKLFSPLTLRCQDFDTLHCGPRHEPKAPCEYLQNLCNGSRPDCIPCVERLPSCIGMPDGDNAVDNKTWISDYVHCYKERTLEVKKCANRFVFDPNMRKCVQDDITTECSMFGRNARFVHPQNCAQYYSCDQENTELGHYRRECPYPQLFDEGSRSCRDGKDVQCGQRRQPTSRCDYELYQCIGINCLPCGGPGPACLGRPDGRNPYPGRELTGQFVMCENGLVMDVGICVRNKIFDPVRRICANPGDLEIISAYCAANPGLTIASLMDCAKFYECGPHSSPSLHTLKECPYSQLFSMEDNTCRPFPDVTCGQRDEPVSPCEYAQFQCDVTDPTCLPCEQRMPSCIGLPDGRNPIPRQNGQHSAEYMVCDGGRTMDIARCWTGYFEPRCNKCISSEFGTLPALPHADVCSDSLVSGPRPVPDLSIHASSMYGIHELMHRYGPNRAHLNYREVKDAQGVTQMGGWVAEKSDLNQWIQVELNEPSLVRGITTQGRNGGYKQWVERYRVLYSSDTHCRKWTTVGGFNVTDAFFKANNDEDSPVTNMFQCPVIAKCVRINPLAWTNYIALRFDLIGCSLNAVNAPTTAPVVSTSKSPAVNTKLPAVMTTSKAVVPSTTPKLAVLGGLKGCLKSCKGMANGDYQSCKSCDRYVTCNWESMFPDRPCFKGLKWDDKKKLCLYKSTTCP